MAVFSAEIKYIMIIINNLDTTFVGSIKFSFLSKNKQPCLWRFYAQLTEFCLQRITYGKANFETKLALDSRNVNLTVQESVFCYTDQRWGLAK